MACRAPDIYTLPPAAVQDERPPALAPPRLQELFDAPFKRRAPRCVPSAEPDERPDHPDPMIGAFSPYCSSEHTLGGPDADVSRPAPRCDSRRTDRACRGFNRDYLQGNGLPPRTS